MASEKLWLAGRVMTKHLDGDRPAGLRTHLLVGRSASTRRSVGDSGGMGHRRQVREKVAQRARLHGADPTERPDDGRRGESGERVSAPAEDWVWQRR